jgi:signal transduction histidine kinase/CheY-like chemotaxis protein
VPAVQAIAEDTDELRRSLRDLVAVSMLPAVWMHYDARQIAESVTEVLVRLLGLEFAFMSLRWEQGQPEIHVARTRQPAAPDRLEAIRAALAGWLHQPPPGEVVSIPDPSGGGQVWVLFNPVAAGDAAVLVAASRHRGFPSAGQRLLLEVTANQAAIAIRRWGAEQALQRLNETLEQRVAAEIEQRMRIEEALRQTQKMEALGQLTGGIAHDFNNLLGAVLGYLKLLRKQLAGDPAHLRLLEGAIEGAERGVSLTRRLLAFARRQELKPQAVDAAALVRGMIEMVRHTIGPAIEIETEFAPDLWPAQVDANQLELALLNLAINARDAMPGGGRLRLGADNATLAAEADGSLAPGDYVRLTLADTGSGMDEATLARASEPFFTTKGVGKGTGLGLSMVHGLAAQSGGALRLSSRPGAGTRAEVWLPRAPRPAEAAGAGVTTSQPPRPGTILLVDDDALVCMATAEMLKDLGHRVFEALSARKALEILRAGTAVDVVVTDQAMPGMTGTELAAEIRGSWPDLPVLLVTGYADLKDGGVKLPQVRKPFDQDELANAIVALMPAGSGRSGSAAPSGDGGDQGDR